jgi:hypothetical protein
MEHAENKQQTKLNEENKPISQEQNHQLPSEQTNNKPNAENPSAGTFNFCTVNKTQEIQIVEMKDDDQHEADSPSMSDYVVEEPFDYIFEPGHYPPSRSQSQTSHESRKSSVDEHHISSSKSEETLDASTHKNNLDKKPEEGESIGKADESNKNYNNRLSRFVREIDGILEYEYRSYNYNNGAHKESDYFNEYDEKHHHLNAVIRSISLSRWPDTGFGFSVASQRVGKENLVYINEIKQNSPAEFCLQLGDIIIEIDELSPSEDFISLSDIERYLQEKENIHLIVIHESKYAQLKQENEDFLKNYSINCEDIVIVSWKTQQKLENVH